MVSKQFLNEGNGFEALYHLFADNGMVPIAVNQSYGFTHDALEYTACSHIFEPVEEGTLLIPSYDIQCTRSFDGRITFSISKDGKVQQPDHFRAIFWIGGVDK